MTTVDEHDLQGFLKTLVYRSDDREHPNDYHRQQFRMGWRRAMQGPPMTQVVLDKRLTWNNLGFRAGRSFGPKSAARVDALFDRLAALYVHEKV